MRPDRTPPLQTPLLDEPGTPLSPLFLPQAPAPGFCLRGQSRTAQRAGFVPFRRLGIRSAEELCKVGYFILAAFLANSFFVMGRNLGTVLFLAHFGSDSLTMVMFTSGMCSVFVGQFISTVSRGRPAVSVNGWILGVGALVLGLLYAGALALHRAGPDAGDLERAAALVVFFGVYVAQDILTMFVAMQGASVAQAAFSVSDAKRLFGLVQLGNSVAAMTVGISIGSLAVLVGTENLLLIQIVVLLVSLVVNCRIRSLYLSGSSGASKKPKRLALAAGKGGAASGESESWWKNVLVLAMGLWSMTVIFTKTMYEYQYNVLVSKSMNSEEMVALTGYLYASAGLASTFINLVGTNLCLKTLGMQGAILATPVALLSVSIAILAVPTVWTTFAGRVVDLSLRWSLNNTVRSVLWIAVPAHQAAAAKPWVEGAVKKMGQAGISIVINFALAVSGGSLVSLSVLSMTFSAGLCVCCSRVYTFYLDSMWLRIKRRERPQLPPDPNIKSKLTEKLATGDTLVQLDMLRQMGENFSPAEWEEEVFSHFFEYPAAVKVRIVQYCRVHKKRIPDDFLLKLLRELSVEDQPALMQITVSAVGDRRLYSALPTLEYLLGDPRPLLRATAATAILCMGWGVGLGDASTAALMVLEEMLGRPFEGVVPARQDNAPGTVLSMLHSRGELSGVGDELDQAQVAGQVEAVRQEWEAAIESGGVGRAVVLAIRLTYLRAGLKALSDKQQPRVARLGSSLVGPPPGAASAAEAGRVFEEMALALQMMQELPDPHALLSDKAWLDLLQHQSHKVRNAALNFVRERDADRDKLLDRVIDSLECSDTYNNAEAALERLNRPQRIQQAVLARLRGNFDRQREIVNKGGVDIDLTSVYADLSLCITSLMKFLRRQCSACKGADAEGLRGSGVCDELLIQSSEVADGDVVQEVYETILDLKDGGFLVTKDLVEARIYKVAEKMCKGLAVREWMRRACPTFAVAQRGMLRDWLQFPDMDGGSRQDTDDKQIVRSILRIGLGCTEEHIYLQKLHMLQLSFIVASKVAASYRSTRVLAAWKLLRSEDAASEAAVLELLESMLPLAVKGVVLPLLSSSPMDVKLQIGASLPGKTGWTSWKDPSMPPPWMEQWFISSFSMLGAQFAQMLTRVASLRSGDPVPRAPASNNILPKISLLSRFNLYDGLLSVHLAAIAMISTIKDYRKGESVCERGMTYVIARGSFANHRTGQTFSWGDVVQELHSICAALHATEVNCTSEDGGTVLCICRQSLFRLMIRLPPKFALGILKNLARILDVMVPPRQTGGLRNTRAAVETRASSELLATPPHRMERFCTAELDADPIDARAPPGVEKAATVAEEDEDEGELEGQAATTAPSDILWLERQYTDPGDKTCLQGRDDSSSDLVSEGKAESVYTAQDQESNSDKQAGNDEEGFMCPQSDNGPGRVNSFSMLEKLILLQEVKMLRYISEEYLPSIARCCESAFLKKGELLCRQGDQTDDKLYMLSDGWVGLYISHGAADEAGGAAAAGGGLGVMMSTLSKPGDTMGNTALLLNTTWKYTAVALEHTNLLTIDRKDLTDVLRGRRELASAIIHGLYKTFTRRLKIVEDTKAAEMRELGDPEEDVQCPSFSYAVPA